LAAEIRRVTKDKWAYKELLLLADPDEGMVGKYLQKGDMFVLLVDGEAACEAIVTKRDDGCVEVKNLATREDMQGHGYGRRMLEYVFSLYKGKSPAVYVGTGDVRAGFYEKLGFRRTMS
jgi:GNAT superfamily N-acetyltransferase